jgi:hypothetical protein
MVLHRPVVRKAEMAARRAAKTRRFNGRCCAKAALVFADALAVGVLALADLTAHEATTEKVVHQLVVHDGTTAEQRAAA